MAKKKDVTVALKGLQLNAVAGRVAAKGVQRIGARRKGKHSLEILQGNEFNVGGAMMHKLRVIDRANRWYIELVINADTGDLVHYVSESLDKHTGHGTARIAKP